jgi:hypothetical protein
MRLHLSRVLSAIGWLAWALCGFGGLAICIQIVYSSVGFWGAAVAFLLSPLTFVATPVYALFALGTWTPLLVCYLGGFVSTALIGAGAGTRP